MTLTGTVSCADIVHLHLERTAVRVPTEVLMPSPGRQINRMAASGAERADVGGQGAA
jgi:hypothetical protein